MATFPLTIVTPDGDQFTGQAIELVVRTTAGDIGIMAGHVELVSALGMGRATVVTPEGRRYAACIGGMLSVEKTGVTLVATTFEWAEEIDRQRAQASLDRALAVLQDTQATKTEKALAQARRMRAMVRRSVAESAR